MSPAESAWCRQTDDVVEYKGRYSGCVMKPCLVAYMVSCSLHGAIVAKGRRAQTAGSIVGFPFFLEGRIYICFPLQNTDYVLHAQHLYIDDMDAQGLWMWGATPPPPPPLRVGRNDFG